jgi:hypothetical protein
MAGTRLRDNEAKAILRTGPQRTKHWGTPEESPCWLRAQPRPEDSTIGSPCLAVPGAGIFHTQPDGMWLLFGSDFGFVDAICVEVCGSIAPTTSLRLPARHVRTLLALPTKEYGDWAAHGVFAAREYLRQHSPLDSYQS